MNVQCYLLFASHLLYVLNKMKILSKPATSALQMKGVELGINVAGNRIMSCHGAKGMNSAGSTWSMSAEVAETRLMHTASFTVVSIAAPAGEKHKING